MNIAKADDYQTVVFSDICRNKCCNDHVHRLEHPVIAILEIYHGRITDEKLHNISLQRLKCGKGAFCVNLSK